MKSTKMQKVIVSIILIIGIVWLFNSNTVFAAINTEYSNVDTVIDADLASTFNNSGLLKSIAKFIYAIAKFLEWILGVIFQMLTGTSDFPWADKIVFNSVPLLDINFFNPVEDSYLGQEGMKLLLRNLYSTILAIAMTFFGIAVAITALKLLISTIASEKAKYKQAIVDWVVGLVMILCIHYFISFVFYLNEQLVVVASRIVKAQLNKADKVAQVDMQILTSELINGMGNTLYKGSYEGVDYNESTNTGKTIKEILQDNVQVLQTYMSLPKGEHSYGLHRLFAEETSAMLNWNKKVDNETQRQRLAMIIVWAVESQITVNELEDIKNDKLYILYTARDIESRSVMGGRKLHIWNWWYVC